MLGHLAVVVCGLVVIRRLRWDKALPMPVRTALIIAGLVLTVLTFAAVEPSYLFSDFRIAYYPAGRAVLEGPGVLGALVEKGVHGFVNLPILAYLFAPLGLLHLRFAIGLFTLAGLVVTLAAWKLLVHIADLRGGERWMLLLLFALSGPLQYSIKEGNTSHWVLFALVLALYLLRAGRLIAAGAVLGVAAVLKLPLLLFGVYLVLRRDWRGTIGFAGVCGAVVASSMLVFGWSFLLHWYDSCVRPFSRQWIAAFNVQSLQSFVLRWQVAPERLNDWAAAYPTPGQAIAGYVVVGLVSLLGFWCCIKGAMRGEGQEGSAPGSRRTREFLLVLCLALVSSPLSWSHYYAWLLIPTAFFLSSRSPFTSGPAARMVGWTALCLTAPLVRLVQFSNPALMAGYVDIGVSHLLFGGLLWFGLIAWSMAQPEKARPSVGHPATSRPAFRCIGTEGRLYDRV